MQANNAGKKTHTSPNASCISQQSKMQQQNTRKKAQAQTQQKTQAQQEQEQASII